MGAGWSNMTREMGAAGRGHFGGWAGGSALMRLGRSRESSHRVSHVVVGDPDVPLAGRGFTVRTGAQGNKYAHPDRPVQRLATIAREPTCASAAMDLSTAS